MDDTVIVALISSGGSVLVAITALVLNYRGFSSLESRMASLESRVDTRLNLMQSGMNSRLNLMQADMRDLNKTMTALEIDVALLKDKTGM